MLGLLYQNTMQVEAEYDIGLTLITLAFVYLFYVMTYTKKSYKIPRPFLLLYGLGGLFLIFKNIGDKHIYITINEIIGAAIALILYIKH